MTRDEPIERRLARIECRLVTLMIHLGLDPYERMYDALNNPRSHDQNAGVDSPRNRSIEAKGFNRP